MLVGEIEDLRQMMERMNRMVTGQGLKKKRRNRGPSGKTRRSGLEEVRTSDDTRQQ